MAAPTSTRRPASQTARPRCVAERFPGSADACPDDAAVAGRCAVHAHAPGLVFVCALPTGDVHVTLVAYEGGTHATVRVCGVHQLVPVASLRAPGRV